MKRKTNYSELQKAHGGEFIAVRNGEVVASAKTHGELVRILKDRNLDNDEIVFEYVRPEGRVCVY